MKLGVSVKPDCRRRGRQNCRQLWCEAATPLPAVLQLHRTKEVGIVERHDHVAVIKHGPTVSSAVKATGISTGSVATALKFLEHDGPLVSGAARSPGAARRINNRDELLNAYAAAAERLRSPISIHVGVLWRDPMVGTIELGRTWRKHNIDWATTSALSASVLAPAQTAIAPLEIRARTNAQRSSPSCNSRWPNGDRRRSPIARSVPYTCGRRVDQPRPDRLSVHAVASRLRRPTHDGRAGRGCGGTSTRADE